MSTRFSGGGGVVAEIFRDLIKPMRFSGGGGGVVAEFFRDLQKPMRFSGGGVVAEMFRDLIKGGRSAEFFFSVTSKRHFPLMGPFYIFYFPEGGGPGPLGPPPESATAITSPFRLNLSICSPLHSLD